MFDGLGNFLQVSLAVLTLSSLAGLGLMRSRVVDLRETIGDLRGEITDKDRRHAEDAAEKDLRLHEAEAQIIQLKAKVNSQAHDLEAVGRLVRGESYWDELGEKLDRHHSEAVTHWQHDEDLLSKILAKLPKGST